MEGDVCVSSEYANKNIISIHSLRMEGDPGAFQSVHNWLDFNPLPPHGGRRQRLLEFLTPLRISIHSLRMEGDRIYRSQNR